MDSRGQLEVAILALFDDTDQLTPEQAFELLSNTRRLLVIKTLAQTSGAMALDELIDQVVAAEREHTGGDVEPTFRESVYASLYQTHLPALADQQVIVYDRTAQTIELTGKGHNLTKFLEPQLNADTRRWPVVYLTLAGTLILAVGGSLSTLLAVEPLTVAAVGAVSLFITALIDLTTANTDWWE